MWRLFFVLTTLLFLPFSTQASDEQSLWEALQEGGKVIMMRHAVVDPDMGDSSILDASCFSEKNLADFGKQQAKSIMQAFEEHAIEVGKVWASPYCRTKETAKLAFGNYAVSELLHLVRTVPDEKAHASQTKIRQILSDYSESANMVMVTHRPNIAEITNQRLKPAQMVIFEPLGDGLFDVLGILEVPVTSVD